MSKITIEKAKRGFVVNVIAANRAELSASKVLKSMHSAIKNVKAQAQAFGVKQVWVETDDCWICIDSKTGVV